MNNILSDLYHGELRPNEPSYPADSDVGILLESFRQNEKWLSELLDGKTKEHLLELVNILDELAGAMTYDSFREGFILSARPSWRSSDKPRTSGGGIAVLAFCPLMRIS